MLPLEGRTCKYTAKIMSKEGSRSEQSDHAPDLSALDFGPAWARPGKGKQARKTGNDKSGHDKAGHGKSGDGKTGDGKTGKGKKGRNDQRDGERGHPAGPAGGRGRRENRRGGREDDRGGQHRGGNRDHFANKGGREHRPVVEPPEGVKVRIMPIEAGMDAMAKQISATGRTHSVFDLAWLVLGALDRFHVIFESKQQPLYRSKSDHSVWMSQKECLAHIWSSGAVNQYYNEEITEVDPPTGNFQSVARCGLSGKLIGPPNHHGYQQALLELHRKRFSNIPIESYKGKIVMEHGEEAVQVWIDAMRQQKHWRPKVEQAEDGQAEDGQGEDGQGEPIEQAPEPDIDLEKAAEPEAAEPEAAIAEDAPEDAQSDSAEAATDSESSEPEAEPVEAEPVEADLAIEETVPIFNNRREVEQHFLAHGFEHEFDVNDTVSALANIPGRMITPGLMTLLKNTVADEKRYPGNLASILCRQMSGRHLAVFKWKKRLHCGPARPRHLSGSMVMADRPDKLFHWVIDHPGGNIDEMWKGCLPAEIDDDTRHTWYHDLHWLINEGLVLLFSDGTLHAAKELEKKAAKKTAKKAAKKATKKTDEKTAAEVPDQVVAQSEAQLESNPVQDEAPADPPSPDSD